MKHIAKKISCATIAAILSCACASAFANFPPYDPFVPPAHHATADAGQGQVGQVR